MLHVTKGIVLHYFNYSDNSVIVKIFTQHFGIQSFILKGIHSKRNKAQKAYLQPLSLVELETTIKENKTLHGLKSIRIDTPYQTIPFNVYKSAIAFFIAEILYKIIKEEEPNEVLFDFIQESLLFFDGIQDKFSNFHVVFLAQLTDLFGFQPQIETYQAKSYFDLQDGSFSISQPSHPYFINQIKSELLKCIFETKFDQMDKLVLSNIERKELLTSLLDYYSIHVNSLSNLKSKQVLEEIFS